MDELLFPRCMRNPEFEQDGLTPDFYTLDLIEDNLGRTSTDQNFRGEFRNANDVSSIGTTPSNLFIANILG